MTRTGIGLRSQVKVDKCLSLIKEGIESSPGETNCVGSGLSYTGQTLSRSPNCGPSLDLTGVRLLSHLGGTIALHLSIPMSVKSVLVLTYWSLPTTTVRAASRWHRLLLSLLFYTRRRARRLAPLIRNPSSYPYHVLRRPPMIFCSSLLSLTAAPRYLRDFRGRFTSHRCLTRPSYYLHCPPIGSVTHL